VHSEEVDPEVHSDVHEGHSADFYEEASLHHFTHLKRVVRFGQMPNRLIPFYSLNSFSILNYNLREK